MSVEMNRDKMSDYVITNEEGDIIAWGRIPLVISRLQKLVRLGRLKKGTYTVTGGVFGSGVTAKRTPFLQLLRMQHRTDTHLRDSHFDVKGDSLFIRFRTVHFADVLGYLAWWFMTMMGCHIEQLDSMLLEIKLNSEFRALLIATLRGSQTKLN